ncbi:dTDP-4-dehydrorhamnose reductase [Streptomyces sp. NPDC001185]|uniref:dTDP-4-dehydrorhamnose reductase n=1 Tax=Streptomyces sp. NPDC001185 TaxID=3154380 RepID=UPI003322713F
MSTTRRRHGWLVTGSGGMLGQDLIARLRTEDEPVTAFDRSSLDITDSLTVHSVLAALRPAIVVNAAAWTSVDAAEAHEEQALAVNGDGAGVLARACRDIGAVLLHVSSDYVFSGDACTPYAEDTPVAPRSAYGRTKAAGERAVLSELPDTGYVVRTGWLYGTGGGNFVRTMIDLEAVRDLVDVVNDQRGQPTWTVDLADRLVRLGAAAKARTAPSGVYHGTSSGETTWYGLAREVFALLGADPERVRPTTSEAFRRPAHRPAYSVLGHERWRTAGVPSIRHWRTALAEAFPALRQSHVPEQS